MEVFFPKVIQQYKCFSGTWAFTNKKCYTHGCFAFTLDLFSNLQGLDMIFMIRDFPTHVRIVTLTRVTFLIYTYVRNITWALCLLNNYSKSPSMFTSIYSFYPNKDYYSECITILH